MVLEEEVKDWFTLPVDKSPHMLFNSWVVEDKKERIPSVVHADGSARVQTVSEINNKKVYMVLQEFFKETGVPVLLNTSFNLGGEPIVESPSDAVRTFTNSNIKGNIKSKNASLGGKLKGNVNSDQINIKKTAEIDGVLNQKTLSIIKPDAVKNGDTGKIYDRIIQSDYKILSRQKYSGTYSSSIG